MGDHQNGHILGIEWEFMSETQCHTPTIWDELYPIEFVLTWGLFISGCIPHQIVANKQEQAIKSHVP